MFYIKLSRYGLLAIALRVTVNMAPKIIYKLDCNSVYAQKDLTLIMRWFYLEACLDGKGSRGLMSLVLMQKNI